MFIYTIVLAIVSIIAGILIAVRSKKSDSITYGKLDRAGRITNVFLMLVYICASPVYLFLGMISTPIHDGFLGAVGWIASILIASASLFCALGLGFSVALRKNGRAKLSFAVQFAGVIGIALSIVLYLSLEGSLIKYLNYIV